MTGIRKQVVGSLFPRTVPEFARRAEKNHQKPVKTIGTLEKYVTYAV
jgi:hypothetical protein